MKRLISRVPSAALRAECRARRQALALALPPFSIALIPAQSSPMMSANIPYRFRQASDLAYLTAFPEDNALLVLIHAGEGHVHSTLLVQPHDPKKELWDGARLNASQAGSFFGTDQTVPMTELEAVLVQWAGAGITSAFVDPVATLPPVARRFLSHPAVAPARNLRPLQDTLRVVKSPLELEYMQRGANVSAAAFRRAMAATRPGVREYQLDALLEYECRCQGASFLAYPPVVAGGSRALTLHYVANNQVLEDGTLVLVDAGAEYEGYATDISRTWPVNGKFSDPQRELYAIVLEVQLACIAAVQQNSQLAFIHDTAINLLHKRLSTLSHRLAPSLADVRQLMPHSIGHLLGMDLHDSAAAPAGPLAPGTVLTIEPGLYLRDVPGLSVPPCYRNIGIRIEDDIVVTEHEALVLTRHCPKTINEVEAACAAAGDPSAPQ